METDPPTIPLPLPLERLERPFLVHILKGPESQDNGTLNAGIRIWEKYNFQDNKIGHDIKIYRIVKIPEPVAYRYLIKQYCAANQILVGSSPNNSGAEFGFGSSSLCKKLNTVLIKNKLNTIHS